jgi:hypothetical protein
MMIAQCTRPVDVWIASGDHHYIYMGRRLQVHNVCYILPKGFFPRVQIKVISLAIGPS